MFEHCFVVELSISGGAEDCRAQADCCILGVGEILEFLRELSAGIVGLGNHSPRVFT
jgi:hypothetical protein